MSTTWFQRQGKHFGLSKLCAMVFESWETKIGTVILHGHEKKTENWLLVSFLSFLRRHCWMSWDFSATLTLTDARQKKKRSALSF